VQTQTARGGAPYLRLQPTMSPGTCFSSPPDGYPGLREHLDVFAALIAEYLKDHVGMCRHFACLMSRQIIARSHSPCLIRGLIRHIDRRISALGSQQRCRNTHGIGAEIQSARWHKGFRSGIHQELIHRRRRPVASVFSVPACDAVAVVILDNHEWQSSIENAPGRGHSHTARDSDVPA
jgi:hypothetical protein